MFAVTSMKIRSYVVITEDMIARNLLPLIPEITMKDNFRELAEKMIKYTADESKIRSKNPRIRSKNFFMSIDFEKLNTNMRNDVVYEPFKFIDNLFGFNNLISRTHEIFHNSLIYTSDKDYLPTWQANSTIPILNEHTWLGHLGGFEGLRQKGWTIVTVAAIWLGSCLPTSLKIASSFRPYSSENIPTLDNCISTISANGMSMCMNDLNSTMSIFSTYLEMSYCYSCHLSNSFILGKGLYSVNIDKLTASTITDIHLKSVKDNQKKVTIIKVLLIYAGVFNGYPVICPLHFIIRGATIWGYMESVISKVRSTSTLQLLAIKNSTKSPLTEMRHVEMVCYKSVMMRCLNSSVSHIDINNFFSRKTAQLLRELSWNKNNIIGVTVPHPAEIVLKYNIRYNICPRCLTDDKNYILTIGSDFISQNKDLAYIVDGPYLPYLGSVTKEKIQSSVEKLPTNPDPPTNSKQLNYKES
ncbi:hypothetical protein GJ496_011449 [Pomphorhynchus laevis]|nr:hypothetical protein GJ496_011449 [Pomphorhynchus laevis]